MTNWVGKSVYMLTWALMGQCPVGEDESGVTVPTSGKTGSCLYHG